MLIKISFGVIIILLNETIFATESVEPKKLDGKKICSTIRISLMLAFEPVFLVSVVIRGIHRYPQVSCKNLVGVRAISAILGDFEGIFRNIQGIFRNLHLS